MTLWRRQRAGDSSYLIQGENITNHVHYHVDANKAEMERLCADLVRTEFDKYSAEAREIIEDRIDEFTSNFLYELSERQPNGLPSLKQPSMQRAIRTAEIEFATSGDIDLGSVLIDLLIELSSQTERTVQAVSLNEAISVAPKLSADHLNTLAILVIVKYMTFHWSSIEEMYSGLSKNLTPVAAPLSSTGMTYRHMQGVGVGWLGANTEPIPTIFLDRYPGLFNRGAEAYEFPENFPKDLLIPSLRDPQRWQVPVFSPNFLDQHVSPDNPLYGHGDTIRVFLMANRLSTEEVKLELVEKIPELDGVMQTWENTNMHQFELTSTGIAIGHAHLRAKVPGPPLVF
ncbi:LPO_1073/Vpar_1526 family protein [Nocardia sp. CA-135398]|uniref:LPO_1073/Vpar_1526 family protein n=1 Tax=Nocardia sp. CA-135398 TaxID=3239977 RepID=UPI003D95E1CE